MSVLGIFLNLPIVNRDEVTRTGPSPPPPSNLLYVVRHNRSKLNNVHGRCSELTAGQINQIHEIFIKKVFSSQYIGNKETS